MAALLRFRYEETESLGKGGALTRISGFAEPHRFLCLGTLDRLEAGNQVRGARNAAVEEAKCRLRGDDCREYLISRNGKK